MISAARFQTMPLNPLRSSRFAAIDDPAERAWAAEWVAAILGREGITVTPESKEHLWSALTSLASAPTGGRTLTGLSVLRETETSVSPPLAPT